ncbi:hypothetical protein EX30DRAFT_393671 [Ascodesmis nigricans]|uniref:Mediator of RNA polymerase II transcription subunit 8 n=1 Tax=Ascodesmis nigricans TaxID=341454 RepID=A0A4S2N4K7_9PEZI|nr:hypothetical protein EX30DRAFT_393671 [Ascodesmis nigricans]
MENPQRSLETLRQRSQQLVHSLQSLISALQQPAETLPPWSVLQNNFNVVSSSVASLSTALHTQLPPLPPPQERKTDAPNALVSYPLPHFPGKTQESTLTQLLTKRHTSEIGDQIYEAMCEEHTDDPGLEERWDNAKEWCQEEQDKRIWGALVTEEEEEAGVEVDQKVVELLKNEQEKENFAVKKGERDPEREILIGMLRFAATGIRIEEQRPLPQAPMKK